MRRRLDRSPIVALVVILAAIIAAGPVLAVSWNPIRVLSSADDASLFGSSLSSSDEVAHLVYQADGRIRYRRSTNLGGAWESARTLATNTDTVTYNPFGIASAGSTVAIVYRSDNLDTLVRYLRVRVSLDGGTTWQSAKTIASYTSDRRMGWGAIAVTNDAVHVAWTDRRTGTIYTRRSIDDGATYLPRVAIGTTTHAVGPLGPDGFVQAAADGSMFYVAWIPALGSGDFGGDIVLRRSDDAGQTFKTKQVLDTRDAHELPALSAAGDGLLIAYGLIDGRQIVARSMDGGAIFTKRTIATPTETLNYFQGDVVLRADGTATVAYIRFIATEDRLLFRTSADDGATWTSPATAVGASPTGKNTASLARSSVRTLVVLVTYDLEGLSTGVWSRSGTN